MTQWNPDAYLKFQDERTQPSYDLAARVGLSNPKSIVDIGCGRAELYQLIKPYLDSYTGVDASRNMLNPAPERFAHGAGQAFRLINTEAEKLPVDRLHLQVEVIDDDDGVLVSLGIFFLAIIISQSTLVGQTTAEGSSSSRRTISRTCGTRSSRSSTSTGPALPWGRAAGPIPRT
jgi:SAM-dependent methyltransferase